MSVYVQIFFGIYKVKCKENKSFTSITRCKPMTPCQSNSRYSCENAIFSPAEDTESVQMCQTAFRWQLMVCCFKENVSVLRKFQYHKQIESWHLFVEGMKLCFGPGWDFWLTECKTSIPVRFVVWRMFILRTEQVNTLEILWILWINANSCGTIWNENWWAVFIKRHYAGLQTVCLLIHKLNM